MGQRAMTKYSMTSFAVLALVACAVQIVLSDTNELPEVDNKIGVQTSKAPKTKSGSLKSSLDKAKVGGLTGNGPLPSLMSKSVNLTTSDLLNPLKLKVDAGKNIAASPVLSKLNLLKGNGKTGSLNQKMQVKNMIMSLELLTGALKQLDLLTDEQQALNGGSKLAGLGSIPDPVKTLQDILSMGTGSGVFNAISQAGKTTITGGDKGTARASNQICTGFIGAPVVSILRAIEGIVDTIAYTLIDNLQNAGTLEF